MHLFMGLLACVFEACSRVLLASWRHGDVTVWYQSNVGKNGPLWADKEQLTEVYLILPSRISGQLLKIQKEMV